MRGQDSSIHEQAEAMTQFELSLVVAKNAFEQWVARCGAAAGANGLSPLELLVLHMTNLRDRKKRVSDLCFGLKIEDTHTVSYALKKLGKAGLVESEKIGTETFFSVTDAGHELIDRYSAVRRRCLIESLTVLGEKEPDLDSLARMLHALSGIYEQAARRAETSL